MKKEDQEFLESLRKDFIDETFDLLIKCEEALLNFEAGFKPVYFQEYMRIIHSIKGSAKAVEFDSIASTIHLIESLGQMSRDHEFVERSLMSLDGVKEALGYAKKKDFPKMETTLTSIVSSLKE